MARKPMKKWNPKYNKVWVRTAMQNALLKTGYGSIGVEGKRFVKEVLAECDLKATENGQEYKKDQYDIIYSRYNSRRPIRQFKKEELLLYRQVEEEMSLTIWVVIGIVCVVVWGWIGWEMYNAPLMPDDYDNDPQSDEWDNWHPDSSEQ